MKTVIDNSVRKRAPYYSWGSSRPYNAYVDYLKKEFGARIQKVIVDAGFTCPNRDGSKGYGGCTYCNNASFKPPYCEPDMSIKQQVEAGISFLSRRYKVDRFLVYFQPYSNTYASLDKLKNLYEQALSHPLVIGLTIGTRPDCIDQEKLDYLQELTRDYYISVEYGLESPYDKSLNWINRQHDFQSWADAVEMTKDRGIQVCAHVILGFPTETQEEMLNTAGIISRYPITDLKIHHLHITRKTILARKYQDNPFHLFELPEYLELVSDFLQRISPDIRIQRLCGETHPRHLIGPNWGLRADAVQRRIEHFMKERDMWQGKLYAEGE
jgi:radical SAM protein (TIGR01212 family)